MVAMPHAYVRRVSEEAFLVIALVSISKSGARRPRLRARGRRGPPFLSPPSRRLFPRPSSARGRRPP